MPIWPNPNIIKLPDMSTSKITVEKPLTAVPVSLSYKVMLPIIMLENKNIMLIKLTAWSTKSKIVKK